jgi:hypothetical protein
MLNGLFLKKNVREIGEGEVGWVKPMDGICSRPTVQGTHAPGGRFKIRPPRASPLRDRTAESDSTSRTKRKASASISPPSSPHRTSHGARRSPRLPLPSGSPAHPSSPLDLVRITRGPPLGRPRRISVAPLMFVLSSRGSWCCVAGFGGRGW